MFNIQENLKLGPEVLPKSQVYFCPSARSRLSPEARFTSARLQALGGALKPGLTNPHLVELSIFINWSSPFPILGVSGVLFHFYFE